MEARQSCVTVRPSHSLEGPHRQRRAKLVGDTQPPLEYLVASSQSSLESYLLSRAAKLAQLRQAIHKLVNEWVQIQGDERTARWILKYRSTEASRAESPASPPRALSTRHYQASLFLPLAREDGNCSHREQYLSQQSLRRHSRISRTRDGRSKFRADGVGSAADSRSDDRRGNFPVRSVRAIDTLSAAYKGDSVDARPAKSSSGLPLAFPPELLACDTARAANNVTTASEPNVCPGIRRCNSNVCAVAAAHFRRAPLSQFLSVPLGDLRLATVESPEPVTLNSR
jgi:hypothetical protein